MHTLGQRSKSAVIGGKNMNNINLVGRVATDLQLKESKGRTYIKFNLAVPRRGKKETTDFIPCIAFEKTAELIDKYLKKGDMLSVIGQLITNQYERNGEKRTSYDVSIDHIGFIGGRKSEDKTQGTLLDPGYNKNTQYDDDDFPF